MLVLLYTQVVKVALCFDTGSVCPDGVFFADKINTLCLCFFTQTRFSYPLISLRINDTPTHRDKLTASPLDTSLPASCRTIRKERALMSGGKSNHPSWSITRIGLHHLVDFLKRIFRKH